MSSWVILGEAVFVYAVAYSYFLQVRMQYCNGHAQELEQSLSRSTPPIVLMSSSVPVSRLNLFFVSLDCHFLM